MFYVHISIFSALPGTSIYLPCPGKKCFLLPPIVRKPPPGVYGCTPLLARRVRSLPPLLLCLQIYPGCILYLWSASEAAARLGCSCCTQRGCASALGMRGAIAVAAGPRSAAGCLCWASPPLPPAGKIAEIRVSRRRNEARGAKCTVKSFCQGSRALLAWMSPPVCVNAGRQ